MYTKISLRLSGIDLRDPDAYSLVPEELSDLGFEANGGVSSAVFVAEDDASPIGAALDAARCIAKHMRGVVVTEVYDELVSTADIAARCEVGAEAVRLWVTGQRRRASRPFPAPRQVVGSGSKPMSLWAWRDVLAWTREVIGLDPDEDVTYLDDSQLAELNAELATLGDTPPADSWHAIESGSWHAIESGRVSVVSIRTETLHAGSSLTTSTERLDRSMQRIDAALYSPKVTSDGPYKRVARR
ncbi:hypothetical protein ACSMXN_05230 [Jatrophihabitans sp. DSM 45814]